MWVQRDAAAARALAAALAVALVAAALLGARGTDPSIAALVNAGVRASELRRNVAGLAAHWPSPAVKRLRLRGGATASLVAGPSDAAPADGGVHEGHAGRGGGGMKRTREGVGARHAAPLRVAPEPGDIIVGHTESCRTTSLAEAVWDVCFGVPGWEDDQAAAEEMAAGEEEETGAEQARVPQRIYVRTGQQTWSGAMTIPSGSSIRIVGPTSAQLCGLWHLQTGTSGSFTGIAAFWGEYDSSKATFIVDGGEWQFEHAELTSASIDVMRISGESRVLMRRCVAGGMDEEARKCNNGILVMDLALFEAVSTTLGCIRLSAIKASEHARVQVSSCTIQQCLHCLVLLGDSVCRMVASDLQDILRPSDNIGARAGGSVGSSVWGVGTEGVGRQVSDSGGGHHGWMTAAAGTALVALDRSKSWIVNCQIQRVHTGVALASDAHVFLHNSSFLAVSDAALVVLPPPSPLPRPPPSPAAVPGATPVAGPPAGGSEAGAPHLRATSVVSTSAPSTHESPAAAARQTGSSSGLEVTDDVQQLESRKGVGHSEQRGEGAGAGGRIHVVCTYIEGALWRGCLRPANVLLRNVVATDGPAADT
jgi:hypothetical protein